MNRFALIRSANQMLKDLNLTSADNICFDEEATRVIKGTQPKVKRVKYLVGNDIFENILPKCYNASFPFKVGGRDVIQYGNAYFVNHWPKTSEIEDIEGHESLRTLKLVETEAP